MDRIFIGSHKPRFSRQDPEIIERIAGSGNDGVVTLRYHHRIAVVYDVKLVQFLPVIDALHPETPLRLDPKVIDPDFRTFNA